MAFFASSLDFSKLNSPGSNRGGCLCIARPALSTARLVSAVFWLPASGKNRALATHRHLKQPRAGPLTMPSALRSALSAPLNQTIDGLVTLVAPLRTPGGRPSFKRSQPLRNIALASCLAAMIAQAARSIHRMTFAPLRGCRAALLRRVLVKLPALLSGPSYIPLMLPMIFLPVSSRLRASLNALTSFAGHIRCGLADTVVPRRAAGLLVSPLLGSRPTQPESGSMPSSRKIAEFSAPSGGGLPLFIASAACFPALRVDDWLEAPRQFAR